MKSFGLAGISPKFFLGNQLSIARTRIAVAGFTFTAGGPNATGPWIGAPLVGGSNNEGAYADGSTNVGVSYGSISAGASINGALVSGIGDDDDGVQKKLCVILNTGGAVAQNFFTSVTFGAPISVTLLTAAATQFNSNGTYPGFTGWFWNQAAVPFFAGSVISVSFT